MAPRSARPPLVALKDVRLQDGPRPLFDGVDLAIEPRSRAALVGRNGAGKSTLMKLVMGLVEADAGDRSVQAGARFAYVPQEPDLSPPISPRRGETGGEAAKGGPVAASISPPAGGRQAAEPPEGGPSPTGTPPSSASRPLPPAGGDRPPSSSEREVASDRANEGWSLLDYAASGAAERWDAEAWLTTFGLDPARPAVNLSGGETRRAALARAFAEAPDLLLLDEPTNHLDILAIELLEREILAARSAVLVVSHDRAFLNRITDTVHWLEGRRVRTLDKGFAAFDAWSAKTMEEEAESLRRLTKKIEAETYTFYRSITAQRTRNEGRARALQALRADRAERLKDLPRELNLGVDSGVTTGKLVAELKGVSKSFRPSPSPSWGGTIGAADPGGDVGKHQTPEAISHGPTRAAAPPSLPTGGEGERLILKPFSTRVMRGDRLAVVGPNGAGKTTLVRILLGELAPDTGTVRLGANLEPVYLDQSRAGLRSDMTLWDALTPGGGDSILVRGQSKHVAAYARDFLFQESQLKQPISTLSGGERNRLLLARALAKPANLLVLDEPTNDLDMDTLDALEDLLAGYDGTLILVSHDRDFVDRLATSTLALNGRGDVVETPGGWTDYVRQNPDFLSPPPGGRPDAKRPEGGPKGSAKPPGAPPHSASDRKPPAKLSYKDARRLEEVERLIETLPADIARHDAALSDPGLYARDPAAFDRAMTAAAQARAALDQAETDWLTLEEKKAALSG